MAKESLVSMNANIDAGVKREIHTCTITAAKALFLSHDLAKETEIAMKQRINMQYYADRIVSDADYKKNINSAPDFVIEMEKLASEMGTDDIGRIKKKLQKMAGL